MLKIVKESVLIQKLFYGGIHVSAVPEVVIANGFIDYITIGEGHNAFPEILKRIVEGNFSDPIVNTWYKSGDGKIIKGKQAGFLQDLDSVLYYEDLYLKKFNPPVHIYFPKMFSEGCPYNCSYCFNYFFRNIPEEKSNYIRHTSVKHAIELLKNSKEKLKCRTIEFWDDIFILNKKWLKEFLIAYKKRGRRSFQVLYTYGVV